MKQLWKENENCRIIDNLDPTLIDEIKRSLASYLPYRRLYEKLTPEELFALLEDAKRLRWEALDLSNCGLDSLPEALGELKDLKFLYFSDWPRTNNSGSLNTFSALPEALGKLSSLKILDLAGTRITALPKTVGALKSLEVMNLTRCPIRSLPPSLWRITGLKSLFLGGTKIDTLPEAVGQLQSLQSLVLWGTKIKTLPDSIGRLSELREVYLQELSIRSLPESLGQLTKLQSINFCDCRLKEIPYFIVKLGLPFITDNGSIRNGVNLTGVTLEEGDISLFSQPRELIEAYYRNRSGETTNECKVIFLGDGEAGKSSIIERIVHNKFKKGSLPTDGVKMTKWSRYPNGKPLTLDGEPLTLRFLDFGGQEIMHSMHRCFLTNHTIYVVVCESRNDAEIDGVAARWMETVNSFAPGCPVILALNKSDLNPNVTVNEQALKDTNNEYRHMVRTSAKRGKDPGIRQLTDSILREVPGCIKKMSGNRDFLNLKNELEAMGADYLLPEKLDERCGHFHIEPSLRDALLNWFQDLGVAYTYTSELQQVYVLNPAWLTNGIYRLILRTENGGFLRHSVIRRTLGKKYPGDVDPEKTYTPQEMQFILQVMRKFEISLRVTSETARDGVEMIPMKMEKTPPARYKKFNKAGTLHLRWEADYLPNNLIHRLIIRKYQELDPDKLLLEKCVWRTGGWFRNSAGEQEALAEQTDKTLDVWVRGRHDARVYMDSFRQEILKILKQLNVEAKEYVFCTVDGKEGKVSYKAALQHYHMGKTEIYIDDLEAFVSPQQLLHENYIDPGIGKRDFFLSYNNGHDEKKAEWIDSVLRASGYSVHFQKDDCKPGMDFMTWMEDAISLSNGFLAVCSEAYDKSYYCTKEIHMAIANQAKKNDYPILPLRAENTPVTPLIQTIVWVDLFSDDEEKNRAALLDAVNNLRRP